MKPYFLPLLLFGLLPLPAWASAAAPATASQFSPAHIARLQRSAHLGYGPSQYELGLAYAAGNGVPQDLAKAAFWWERAAVNLDARAQVQIGQAYAHGWGVSQNASRAVYWWKRATQDGDRQVAHQAQVLLDRAA